MVDTARRGDKADGLWSRFLFKVEVLVCPPSGFRFTNDSTGTSFPSTWHVKTKETCMLQKNDERLQFHKFKEIPTFN